MGPHTPTKDEEGGGEEEKKKSKRPAQVLLLLLCKSYELYCRVWAAYYCKKAQPIHTLLFSPKTPPNGFLNVAAATPSGGQVAARLKGAPPPLSACCRAMPHPLFFSPSVIEAISLWWVGWWLCSSTVGA